MPTFTLSREALLRAFPTFHRYARAAVSSDGLLIIAFLLFVPALALLMTLFAFAGTAWTSFPLVALIAIIQFDILARLGYLAYYKPVPLDSEVAFPETEDK